MIRVIRKIIPSKTKNVFLYIDINMKEGGGEEKVLH